MTLAMPRTPRRAPLPVLRPATAPPAPVVRTPTAVNPVVRAAFYLFVLAIPFEIPHRVIPIEVPTLFGLVFLLATLINPSACYRWMPKALWWFGAYLWVFGLSTLVNRADHTGEVLRLFLSFAQLLLILWTGANVLRDPRVLRGALLTLGFACALRAGMQVLGIAAQEVSVWTGGVRVTVLGQNPNLSAIILSAGLITALNLRPRVLFWPIAAVMGLAVIQTGSRGGLLCVAAGLVVLLWQGGTAWQRIRNGLVGLVALALLLFGVSRSEMMRTRFETAATEGALAGRERIYPAVLGMIGERPLLGWGPVENTYEIARRIDDQHRETRGPHNLVFELLSATGVLGMIPFLVGLWLCIRAGWRARHGPLHMLPFALLAAVLMGTVSGTWIAAKILWLVLAIALATGETVARKRSVSLAC